MESKGQTYWTVLVVDDEQNVRTVAQMSLEKAGFRVLSAASREEAERVCREHPGAIDAVVMDVILGAEHGIDAIPCLRDMRPEIAVLYISGYPGRMMLEASGNEAPFLSKPFTPEELVEAVTHLLTLREVSAPRAA